MKITVIAKNYNNLEGLKRTINSVLEQSYSTIEYIIVDGDSTDRSRRHKESSVNYFIY